MTESPGTHEPAAQPFTGMGCPRCGYNLTGAIEPRCPECGKNFDPDKLRPYADHRRLSWRVTVTAVLLATYLPNTWVFWIDYPWNDYRMTWVKMFPLLPGFLPSAWLTYWTGLYERWGEAWMLVLAGIITLLLIVCGILLARRSWWWLVPVCIAWLAFEGYNAYISHALFRM